MTEQSLFATRRPRRWVWPVAGLVVLAVVAAAWISLPRAPWGAGPAAPSGAARPVNTATYTCDGGKTITAQYYDAVGAVPQPAPGQPPVPTGSVALALSDGRQMTLPQTLSASGIRYANPDESFIFWSKGNTAFVEEGATQQQTFTNCVTAQ